MSVATIVEPVIRTTLGSTVPIHITCWDGSEIGPPTAPMSLKIKGRRALRRMLWAPNELGLARAYVSGDVEIGGDLLAGLQVLERVALPETGLGVVDSATRRALVKAALKLGVVGLPPKPRLKRPRWRAVNTASSATQRPLRTTTTSATTSTKSFSENR
jgi:cyclopropane-fatty-acyl-phospholipid synthase